MITADDVKLLARKSPALVSSDLQSLCVRFHEIKSAHFKVKSKPQMCIHRLF